MLDNSLIPNTNPNQVYLDLEVLRLFDERQFCPLYNDKDAEFIVDPRVIMDMYVLNNEEYPSGTANKLNKLTGKTVLFKREEPWSKINIEQASAPGYFTMYIENENGDWVLPFDYKPFDFTLVNGLRTV